MHAYLIISKHGFVGKSKAEEVVAKHGAKLMPFELLKIADVRSLKAETKFAVKNPVAFFIENIEEASIDALNAFLKQLEEPAKNVYYILTASSEDKVLQTIVSRCEVIRVISDKLQVTSKKNEFEEFVNQQTGSQLQFVDKIKKREDAIEFLHDLIEDLHVQLVSDSDNLLLLTSYLSHAQTALTALEKNGNVTIQLTRMVVEWNKSL